MYKLLALTVFSFLCLLGCDQKSVPEEITTTETDNKIFSCSAGDDLTYAPLGSYIYLTGSVSNPVGDSLSYSWTASSDNPSVVTLSNSQILSPNLNITMDMGQGDYDFTLSVNDGTNTVTDTITVSVNFMDILLASDGDIEDFFGCDISLSSDGMTALIGASEDDDSGNNSGSVYIFANSGNRWSQMAKLTASDGDSDDKFGEAVSLSSDGKTALIGAYRDDNATGSAYIFTGTGSHWIQTAKLTASDGLAFDLFGISLSLSSDGKTALIGTSGNDDRPGAAYIFTDDGNRWNQTAKLASTEKNESIRFGKPVSLSSDGKTALIGDRSFNNYRGSAYIFTNNGDSWSQTAKLTASDGGSEDIFGVSLSLSSDGMTALIGAPGDDDIAYDSGAAYIFSSTDWKDCTETAKLTASDGDDNDRFGKDVSLSSDGTTVVIGVPGDNVNTSLTNTGSVYVYSSTYWKDSTETVKLTASEQIWDEGYGRSVCLSSDGTRLLIGAKGAKYNGSFSGMVYSYLIGY